MLIRRALSIAAASACLLALAIPAQASPLPGGALSQFVHDVLSARSLSTGRGVTIAILGSGVDPSAAGLSGRVTVGPDYAFAPREPLVDTSGTIAATVIAGSGPTGNSPGLTPGIAPDTRILSIRTGPDNEERGAEQFYDSSDTNAINAEAIRYAVNHGAQVIYVSICTSVTPSQDLWSAVQYAIAKNAVIVANDMQYNSASDGYKYPAGLPGVIGVAATDLRYANAPYDESRSVQNNSILVAAPGNSVMISTGWQIDGPFAAAAWVTGAVALIKSVYPDLSPAMVARALANSALYHPAGGYDTGIGFGLVNPDGALQVASTLAKLSKTAQPGQGVAADASFNQGAPLGTIDAVHHSPAKLALYAGAIAAGLAMLLAAAALAFRTRRRKASPAG